MQQFKEKYSIHF